MRYAALVNGTHTIAAGDLKTLMRKASMIANKSKNEVDEMVVEGLGGRNRPVLLCRASGKSVHGKTWYGNWN